MPYCAKCQLSFDGDRCLYCGAPRARFSQWIGFWRTVILAALVMVLGGATFAAVSSLVDRGPVTLAILVLFLAPFVAHYVASRSKTASNRQRFVRMLYIAVWAGAAVLVAAVFMNELLDRGPVETIQATVIHKSAGRYSHSLYVAPSWRAGRTFEALDVSGNTYATAQVGGAVSVELHGGFFHLLWYNHVTSADASSSSIH